MRALPPRPHPIAVAGASTVSTRHGRGIAAPQPMPRQWNLRRALRGGGLVALLIGSWLASVAAIADPTTTRPDRPAAPADPRRASDNVEMTALTTHALRLPKLQ